MSISNVKLRKRNSKHHPLPSIDDDDDLFDLSISTPNNECRYACSTTSLSPNEEDEDDEFPVGLTKTSDKSKKLKVGDLMWIKHSKKYCFWPSYVKSLSAKKIAVYFIGFHKFTESERSFRYNLSSKNVKKFPGKDKNILIDECREFINKHQKKSKDKDPTFTLSSFNEAVEIAESYTLYRSNNEFLNQQEELDFFRSNGLLLNLKNCGSDCNATTLSRPPTPVEQKVDLFNRSSSLTLSTESNSHDSEERPSRLSLIQNNELSDHANASVLSRSSECESHCSPEAKNSFVSKRLRKRTRQLTCFNNRNDRLVEYILYGQCNDYLFDVFQLKVPSKRMQAYFNVWDLQSSSPKANNLKLEQCYFINQNQLEIVCKYLQGFINNNFKEVVGLVPKHELLFNVFVPEAIIYSIHKVKRRPLHLAEQIFNQGYSSRGLPFDPLLNTPLTDDERAKVERKNRNFLESLNLSR